MGEGAKKVGNGKEGIVKGKTQRAKAETVKT